MIKIKRQYGFLGGALLLIALVLAVVLVMKPGITGKIVSPQNNTTNNVENNTSGKASIDLYVMSLCPYGTQTENSLKPVLENFSDVVSLNINYIANKNPDGSFSSLHGQKEVNLDMVQLCAKKYYPDKYFDFIICQNNNLENENVKFCAQNNEMDQDKILSCAKGEEGKELLSASIKKSQEAQATASPTIYINGKMYNGGRTPTDFSRAICSTFDYKIAECENVPKPVEFELIVLNDKNCNSCNPSKLIMVSEQLFPGIKTRKVDVSSPEGKKLVKDHNIVVVPTYLFDKKIEETQIWKTRPDIRPAFEKTGNMYKLKDEITGATYYIDEEARKEYYKKIGVTLGDNRPQIDYYVMSFCPYGNQAEEAIEKVYRVLKDKADFNPHYVIYSNYAGGSPDYCFENGEYCSMHGIQELNQDIRELCVNKYFGIEKYFEFTLAINKECSSKNVDSCWEGVAKDLNLDVQTIKDCEKGEKIPLAKKEQELNKLLKVSGSPTVFIDGQLYNGPRTPQGYLDALCSAFEKEPKECNTVLTSETSSSSGGTC